MAKISKISRSWATLAVYVAAVLGLIGCTADVLRPVGLAELEDPDTVVRIRAIHWAGENAGQEAVPLLVERLTDDDKSVRLYAIASLQQITGKDYGYDYKANASQRAQAVTRWRQALQAANNGGENEQGKARTSE